MNTARNNDQHEEIVEFIRLPKVLALVGLSQTTIYDMANAGRFPKQVKLGGRAVAWVKSEVLQWNLDRLAAARGDQSSASSESR
ncbi:helix-turn-helix transcriptional regulator [Pseudomonas sp. GL-B-16]|uniref:helix-turn-helix transcriptional regulator n=1 Tax=Pseudomonas sp. GL-B-16 TaxID=2832373 RepID=UPI001CBCDE50|nr:AlpA family transcriptional regulator [Pseudomonas sp. GL-B-16]